MNQKRIVIIEGDAFDADAIVAIYGIEGDADTEFAVKLSGVTEPYEYEFESRAIRDVWMKRAIDAWRSAVGDVPVETMPPEEPQPTEETEDFTLHWRDEKGRYYETYGGNMIWTGTKTGRFIWNEGPPRRKNPLGPGASPILRVYVDDLGKPLDPQPI